MEVPRCHCRSRYTGTRTPRGAGGKRATPRVWSRCGAARTKVMETCRWVRESTAMSARQAAAERSECKSLVPCLLPVPVCVSVARRQHRVARVRGEDRRVPRDVARATSSRHSASEALHVVWASLRSAGGACRAFAYRVVSRHAARFKTRRRAPARFSAVHQHRAAGDVCRTVWPRHRRAGLEARPPCDPSQARRPSERVRGLTCCLRRLDAAQVRCGASTGGCGGCGTAAS